MSSILDLVGSFIIGGFLMLMILRVNTNFNEMSTEDRLELMVQECMIELVSEIEYDFRKIGYGVSNPSNAIISADTSSITFRADIDNDGNLDQVGYLLGPTSGAPGTPNPNDRVLFRTVNGQTVGGALGVVDFQLVMYDDAGAQTTNTTLVKSIDCILSVESPYPVDSTYAASNWTTRMYPANL